MIVEEVCTKLMMIISSRQEKYRNKCISVGYNVELIPGSVDESVI